MLLWVLCGALAVVAAGLLCKLLLLRRDLAALVAQLGALLDAETNAHLRLPSRDRLLRRLAAALDGQLRRLRRQQLTYLRGDRELKEAVTNVSHDLRTPLTAICGYLELLEGEPVSDAAARCLTQIRGRVDAMRVMTEELLRYSVVAATADALLPERVSLNRAVEESVAGLYASFLGRGIEPEIALPAQPVYRMLDAAALGRVLGNILTNALQHSGGDLQIFLTESGTLRFQNRAPQLTQVQVERLFDRYFTVESGRANTGLGLSIAKRLTERMGGHIGAALDAGVLTVTVEFPE